MKEELIKLWKEYIIALEEHNSRHSESLQHNPNIEQFMRWLEDDYIDCW